MARRIKVRPLRARDREQALAYLERNARLNLLLIDLVMGLRAKPRRGEGRRELLAAFRGEEIAGLAALAPSVVLDAAAEPEALEALIPYLGGVGSGLVKSKPEVVDPLWEWLEAQGRRALLDRIEIAYALEPGWARLEPEPPFAETRAARLTDLEALVESARASLREEQRPDPFDGDPVGFRRWVQGRIPRATVLCLEKHIAFVGYADVRCARGWLLQGIYTWPEFRRRGLARVGVSSLCRTAFAAGADHVQLAVVEGNDAAQGLYEGLGFRRFARLRTLLFA